MHPESGRGEPQLGGTPDCLDNTDVVRLVEGDAPPSLRTHALEHAASCDACRELLALVGRARAAAEVRRVGASTDSASLASPAAGGESDAHLQATIVGAPAVHEAPEAPRSIGRYVVLGVVGEGAMGQVLRAYDPKLRREVALKVVRTRGHPDAADAEARLLREAHALARLSHANVVAVYDADITERGVAIAMEYVEGRTLRAWLEERPRTWKAIVDVGVCVAAGLAAAHAAGLVHRDVKPDNVLVGNDGRVRVSDFGLARRRNAEPDDGSPPERDLVDADATLTETGQIVGTPAYMAPEQYAGVAADARADQYALCLLLYEALHGARPFRERDLRLLAARKRQGPPSRPPTAIPRWLHAAVVRGLAPAPADRWPSVEALRQALMSGRRRSRRWRFAAALGAGVALVGAYAVVRDLHRRAARSACVEEGDAFVAEHTDEAARAELHAAIAGSGVNHAVDTADRVLPLLDAYARELQHARTDVCSAATVDPLPAWDADMLDRASWCLDDRKSQASALRTEMLRGDVVTMRHGVQAASSLPPVHACADTAWLARDPVPPPESREDVRAVRSELSRARALALTGAYTEGLAAARAAHERAEALAWPPLSAGARAWVGDLLGRTGAYDAAATELEAAYFEAAKAGTTEVAVDAANDLVRVLGWHLRRHDDALRWSRHAEVALASLPDATGLLQAEVLANTGFVHSSRGAFAQAAAAHERSLALREAALGAEHVMVVSSLTNLATARFELGERREGRAALERALALQEQIVGAEHPDVAVTLNNLGAVHMELGAYAEAEAVFERALRIRRAALGNEHPDVAATLMNLGAVNGVTGDPHAKERLEESLRIRERVLPPDHADVAASLLNLGLVHKRSKDYAQARHHYERALACQMRALGPDHVEVAKTLVNLGVLAHESADDADAQARFERALAIAEAELGPTHALVAAPLFGLAEVALSQGRAHDAVLVAERAVHLRENGGAPPLHIALGRFVLARALAADGDDSARPMALAEQARDEFRKAGDAGSLAAVEAWLQQRAVAPREGP